MRSPQFASRINFAKPCSSTPARIRARTYSRLYFSSTTVSTPCRCRSCDSRRPDGPPPMMQTWTFIAFPPYLDDSACFISARNGSSFHFLVQFEHAEDRGQPHRSDL